MRPLHLLGFNPRHRCEVLAHGRTFEILKSEGRICLADLRRLGKAPKYSFSHWSDFVLQMAGSLLLSNRV